MKQKLLAISILCIMLIASILPPQLPSRFYGYVIGGKAGQSLVATVGGNVVASTTLFSHNRAAVYVIEIPMDGVVAGTTVKFQINGVGVGGARLYSGTNKLVNLYYVSKYLLSKKASKDR